MKKIIFLLSLTIFSFVQANPAHESERLGLGSGMVLGAIACGPVCSVIGSTIGIYYGEQDDLEKQRINELEAREDMQSSQISILTSEVNQLYSHNQEFRNNILNLYQSLSNDFSEDLLFSSNESNLSQAGSVKLESFVNIIQAIEELSMLPAKVTIYIDGYADYRGTQDENLRLSEARALAVREFLIENGINPNTIVTTPYGESQAIYSNENPELMAFDRKANISLNVELITETRAQNIN